MSTFKNLKITYPIKKGDCFPLSFINEDRKTVRLWDDNKLDLEDLDDIDDLCGLVFRVKKVVKADEVIKFGFQTIYGDIYVTPDILKNYKYMFKYLTEYQIDWIIRSTGSRTMGSHGEYEDNVDGRKDNKNTQWIYKTGKKNYSVLIISSDEEYMKNMDRIRYKKTKIFDESLLINMSL